LNQITTQYQNPEDHDCKSHVRKATVKNEVHFRWRKSFCFGIFEQFLWPDIYSAFFEKTQDEFSAAMLTLPVGVTTNNNIMSISIIYIYFIKLCLKTYSNIMYLLFPARVWHDIYQFLPFIPSYAFSETSE